MTLTAQYLWVIPALPLAAAAVGALTPKHGGRLAASAAIAAMAGAFLLSCLALYAVLHSKTSVPVFSPDGHRYLWSEPTPAAYFNFGWFELGHDSVRLGFLLDPLTALMCVMVTFVSLLVFIFSTGYMKTDANYKQFFCFLSFFAAAMLGLLIANSLLLLFICWELVGLASYLLIGFWFTKPAAAAAAKKAFIVTRIGDLGFLLGLVWINQATGTTLFYDNGSGFLEMSQLSQVASLSDLGGLCLQTTAIGLLIFCGAVGKSGQFPLHVWLPDAMEGPTPVSALIHAATMVAAGVFLVVRIFPLMMADQFVFLEWGYPQALTTVALLGAFTAFLGAALAVAQNDIKRILAFSTVSQLGYMMMSVGVGWWYAALFHLLTHAFFKALLFLGAGSVIHSTHHEQDIRRLGGLRTRMKVTFATFAVGMMALSGVPFLFSGFWSKEAILHGAYEWKHPLSGIPLYLGLAGVVLTAFYMTRLVAEVFFGTSRSAEATHAKENRPAMTMPLVVLAVGAVLLGFLGTPTWPWLQSVMVGAAVEPEPLSKGRGLMLSSIGLVALGIGAGWALYGHRPRTKVESPDPLAVRAPGAFAALAGRLGFDELYAATVGRLADSFAAFCAFLEIQVWDGAVRFLAGLGQLGGLASRDNDEQGLNGGFDSASESLRDTGTAYSKAQTGDAHGYLRTIALGFVVLLLIVIVGGAR